MATFLGYSNFSGKNGDKFSADLLYDILEKNIAGNYYKVRLYGYIRSWGYSGSGNYAIFYINGQNAGGFSSISANQYSEVARLDVTVPGDDLGNCNLNWSFSVSTSWTLGSASNNGTLPLEKIPRASSVSSTSGNIEEAINININRASDKFTHNLYYSFGNINDVLIASNISTNYNWLLPADLYAQIPSSQYGTGVIKCNTYNGSTYIGQTTCSFTAYANQSKCKPNIEMTVVDTNEKAIALTGNNQKLIKFVSNAKATLSVSGKNSASIKSSSVYCGNGQTVAGTSAIFNNTDSNYFKGNTIDTRGYSNSVEKSLEMINYIILTLNASVFRPLQTGNEIKALITGNYFNGSFGSESNTISLKYRYCENGQSYSENYASLSPTLNDDGTYKIEASLGTDFDYKKSYKFEFVVEDKVNKVSIEKPLSRGIPIHAMFEKFFEYWGIKSFEISEDGSTLILNGNIKISGSNKLLKDL